MSQRPVAQHQICQCVHNEKIKKKEEREKGVGRILEELMLKNFAYLMKNINIYIQEEDTFSSSHGTFCRIDHI